MQQSCPTDISGPQSRNPLRFDITQPHPKHGISWPCATDLSTPNASLLTEVTQILQASVEQRRSNLPFPRREKLESCLKYSWDCCGLGDGLNKLFQISVIRGLPSVSVEVSTHIMALEGKTFRLDKKAKLRGLNPKPVFLSNFQHELLI